MEFTVADFAELLDELEYLPEEVCEVSSAWGEGSSGTWEGGFCFEDQDGKFHRVVRPSDGPACAESRDSEMYAPQDPLQDFVALPGDLARWLEDGAPIDEIYSY